MALNFDVVIIGGGLVGLWSAYFMRRKGLSVAVLERGRVCAQASGVNFGSLRLQGRFLGQLPMALHAQKTWRAFEAITGESCEFEGRGHLHVALNDEQFAKIDQYAKDAAQYGLHLEMLEAAQVLKRWPWFSPRIAGASWSPGCAAANPRLAGPALGRAVIASGVTLMEMTEVRTAVSSGEGFTVELADGQRIGAGALVNAAGAWGAQFAAAFTENVPLFAAGPADMVTEPMPYFMGPTIQAVDGSIVARQIDRGNVIIAGHPRGPVDMESRRARVPSSKIGANMTRLADLVPALASARLIRSWTGLEGYLPDMLPVISKSVRFEGLVHAFGLSGHGFQISPAVGEAVCGLVTEGRSPVPVEPFDIRRFDAEKIRTADDMDHEFDQSILQASGVAGAQEG